MDYVAETMERNVVRAGFCATIFAATVGLASTSAVSREIIELFRLATILVALAALLAHFLIVRGFHTTFLTSLFFLITLYITGLSLGLNYGGVKFVLSDLVRDFGVAVLLLYFLAAMENTKLQCEGDLFAKVVFIYIFFLLVLLVLSKGLLLDYPPRFVNEYSTAERGSLVQYSQGISKVFALGAIAATFCFFISKGLWKVIAFVGIAVFIALSLLGGARGDSVAGMFVVGLVAFRFAPVKTALFLLAIFFFFINLSFAFDLLSDFIIFQRFLSLSSGVETRASLLSDAVLLLADNPACLFHGCGFGYFQQYYGYSSGLYPHNFILEFLISLGVVIFVPLSLLAAFGIFSKRRRGGFFYFASYVFLYFFLVSLKSGALLSAWLVLVPLVYYAAVGLSEFNRNDVTNGSKGGA